MSDALYERDALAWADQQAALLRRLAQGERLNEVIDWANVIEEVQDVGLSELHACQNLFLQAMTHLLKLSAWPHNASVRHWTDEVGAFLDSAALRYTPSMRQRIGLDGLFTRALRRAVAATDASGAPVALPQSCPFTLDALLAGDVAELLTATLTHGRMTGM